MTNPKVADNILNEIFSLDMSENSILELNNLNIQKLYSTKH